MPLYQHVLVGTADAGPVRRRPTSTPPPGSSRRVLRSTPSCVRIARDDCASTPDARPAYAEGPARSAAAGVPSATAGGSGSRAGSTSLDRLDARRAAARDRVHLQPGRAATRPSSSACAPGIRLTTPEERDEIHAFVEEACADLPDEDRARPRLPRLPRRPHPRRRGPPRRDAAGVQAVRRAALRARPVQGRLRHRDARARHQHAGPHGRPREAVEVERRDARRHHAGGVHPADRTRGPPRARRRGARRRRSGSPASNPAEVAGLASTRTYPLRSSFRPSYNMAVNLVHQVGRARARELLEMSFAQFQADKAVVGLARQLAQEPGRPRRGTPRPPTCDRGDFMEYAALRQRVSELEKNAARARRADRRDEVIASLERAAPGRRDRGARRQVRGVRRRPRPRHVGGRTAAAGAHRRAPGPPAERGGLPDSRDGPRRRLRIPRQFNARNPQMRRDLASSLRTVTHGLTPPPPGRERAARPTRTTAEIEDLRRQLREHPCHDCPDREDHARWAERWFKLDRDARTLERRVEQRTNTVARQFDRVCDVLETLGYLADDDVTDLGRPLRRIYSELDLVVAECAARRASSAGLGPSGAGRSAVDARLRGPATRGRRLAARPRWRHPAGDRRPGAALARARPTSSASTGSTSSAGPTPGSPGRRTAGPRATTSPTCWTRAT